MESTYIGPKAQDSRQYRSRSIAQLPSTNTTIQGLNIVNTSKLSKRLLHSNSGFRSSSLGVVSEVNPQPLPVVTASNPQLSAPLSAPSQDDFDWTFGQSRGEQASSPLLALDAAASTPREQSVQKSSAQTAAHLANMSAVAIQQYDSHFDAGMAGVRQSYTWPSFDMGINQQFFSPMSSPALSTTMTQFEEPKMMPVYARSLSSSPPRGSLTPEQRELKKQRDYARRDSKAKYRRERSTSNPYVVSQQPSPALLPGALPDFASSVSPSPLLSHATPVIPSTGYLGPFATAINDGTVPDLYAPVYSMGPNDFTSPAYAMPFADPITSLQPQSFVPRVPSATEQQLFHPQPQLHLTPKLDSADHVRVVHSRPKPQCWEHGCNGRQFSTFSNLLRHQREKSGVAAKSSCPNCGAEFTRTTARNGHMAHEKCKQRRNS